MGKIRGVHPEFWTDEDIVELSIPARLLFIGLWNLACDNGHLDDKPKQIKMRVLPADDVDVDALLDELVWRGRIERQDGTITIPKFAQHQKPHRKWWKVCTLPDCKVPEGAPPQGRNGGKGSSGGSDNGGATVAQPEVTVEPGCSTADVDGEGDGEREGDTSFSSDLTIDEATRDDVERICTHLADRIEANGSKRPTITKKWHDAARLMLDRDKRAEQEVHGAIDWCQTDEFWRSNILSLPKLREKYEALRLQAQRAQTRPARPSNTNGFLDDLRAGIYEGPRVLG